MKVHGVKREWSSPIFCLKTHYCPCCNDKLEKTETIVNSASEEAKNYDFSNVDTFMVGNINFIRTAFRCSKCDKTYSIDELKKAEKASKKREYKKTAADLMVGGCTVLCHAGAKCGYFQK